MKIEKLTGKSYFTCAACMSVWADALSWANANTKKVTKFIANANNIIVLACQVTDLAILNDFRTAENLRDKFPDKNIFISGCLSERKDIPFPEGIERLDQMRCNCQEIKDKTLVNFEKPFWVPNFKKTGNDMDQGNIFREKYPLRIGKGCPFNCTYCTIKYTRGKHEKYDINEKMIQEFVNNDNILLIADSPTAQQIKDWCNLAIEKNKSISMRNVEPQVAIKCKAELISVSQKGLLDIFHCPIQSNDVEVLKDMQRNVSATLDMISVAESMKQFGTKIATNIIIDYKDYPNDFAEIYDKYDYVSWNPLWNNVWNREEAELRFKRYINQGES